MCSTKPLPAGVIVPAARSVPFEGGALVSEEPGDLDLDGRARGAVGGGGPPQNEGAIVGARDARNEGRNPRDHDGKKQRLRPWA
ncbi:uncharacterized protein SOCE26_026570 [Sorangium cellulosum]|uniref:Uncharacterized protein n=2 Tax=Sorangium cellulosum TaxID=56 RepID=A0A2L0EPL0_SORCE|nr:uncharacterized protein SOCE26_026570 [Sorangium cellulosum]